MYPKYQDFVAKVALVVRSMGYRMLACTVLPAAGRSKLIRLYIDHDAHVTVADCALVSAQVNALLAVDELITGRYVLEVSSPGIDRPLFDLADYQHNVGNKIKLSTTSPLMLGASVERKNFSGTIHNVSDDGQIQVLLEGNVVVAIPFAMIKKAQIVGDYNFNGRRASNE